MEFALFMLFSIIESFAFFSLTFALYRLQLRTYLVPATAMIIIMNLVSFYLRKESDLVDYAPAVSIILIVLFMMAVVKIPVIWAFIVSLTGYAGFGLIQTGVIMQLSFGFLSVKEVGAHAWKGYLLQAISGVVVYILSRELYKRGLGFSFDFANPIMKAVALLLTIAVVLISIVFGTVLFIGNAYIVTGIYLVALLFLLFYGLRKETKDAGFGA